mgnify:CR=1 FL=1
MLNPPTRKPKSEENMPERKIENYCETIRARHVFYSRRSFGGTTKRTYATNNYRPILEGLIKKLHATYLSYMPENSVSRPLVLNRDPRGDFVEVWRISLGGVE